MSYQEIKGNLFNSKAQAYVNTVNCVGAMGKGIALEFRRRYPIMFEQYKKDCEEKKLIPGRIYAYEERGKLILNFAIKNDWKHPSKIEWIESTLKQFVAGYKNKGIKSVAFPWMGAMNGGLPFELIQSTMREYLKNLSDVEVEVYTFDPDAPDELFEVLLNIISSGNSFVLRSKVRMKDEQYRDIEWMIKNGTIKSLSRLDERKILGKTSMVNLYNFLSQVSISNNFLINSLKREDEGQYPLF